METASPATETSARDAAVKAKMAEKNICWGIEFTHWPQVANAWKNRERPSGWPSIQAINEVLDGGFHMLPIGVSDNKERRRLEWRYSFGVADKLLAKHHLPSVARKVYIYLRLLQVHFFSDPPMIPTYFMQNFFLWLLDSWDDDKLADVLLLVELIEAVKQRDIRHYFIPEVNLLVDLPPTFAGIISAKILHFNRNQRVGLQALVHGTLEVLGRICEQLSTEEDPRVVLHLRAQLNTFVRVTYDLWGAQHGQGVHTMLGGHTLLEFVFESLLLSSLPPLLICKALHFLQADAYCRQLFECDGPTVSPSNAYKRLDKGNLAGNIRSKLRVTLSMLELMESDPITDNVVLYRGKNENVKSTDMGLTMRFTINNPDDINTTQ
ncbi:hypothetical protein NP493_473g02036 [Ridgeia piscesae]|uniref:Mab-21-like HhH/H2TH-like domain-containing protein n=1 Tax=Ridgeia piscesae TaxID=27915 RepID=A0AAD9KYL3_RIDPI|nr:hypothetical protein NP493_473g02036 [Ridgeia piscesae]